MTSGGSHAGETSLNFNAENQPIIAIESKNDSDRVKILKPQKIQSLSKFKIGLGIFYNSEMWGNKGDGLRMNLMRCHLINCRIRQNSSGAIFMEGKQSEK